MPGETFKSKGQLPNARANPQLRHCEEIPEGRDMQKLILRWWFMTAILAIAIAGTACSKSQETAPPAAKEYKTKTGKTILIKETHPVGQTISTIIIHTIDFEHNMADTLENVDPISEVLMADLDGNGFDEIYIITTSAGSGSYGNVVGYAANFDKSLSRINFPGIQKDDEMFAGYMGHDRFVIENQKLIRTFPIYKKGDTNRNPAGGMRKLNYGLHPGEAMWQLKIEKSEILNNP